MSDIIRLENVSKQFGEVHALTDVSFAIHENEIMGLVGDNGAGKSTLIKIISGILQQDSGTVYVRGNEVEPDDYKDAEQLGIETIYQELGNAPHRTVAENIFLGDELLVRNPLGKLLRLVDDTRMEAEARNVLRRLELDLNPKEKVRNFSGGEQQSVAIARALQSDPEVVIMDEPTSALSVAATERVHDLVKRLKEAGTTIIYITHDLESIFELTDRAAVLHSGRLVGIVEDLGGMNEEELVSMMMGRRMTAE